MKYKQQLNKFIKSFEKEGYDSIDIYNNVLKLHKQGFNVREIKEKLNLSEYKIYNWITDKTTPHSVRYYNLIKEKDYFNTSVLIKNLQHLAYLIGYNLGDGNISKNFNHTWFYGVNKDLEEIKSLLLDFKVKPKIYTYKIDNGKMVVNDIVFSRFLYSFGAVKGDKTKSDYDVPAWIIKSKKRSIIKKRFLQGLCDSEMSRISEIESRRFSFQSLKYYMIKEKNHVNSGIEYLNQLSALFFEFDVTTTEVKRDRVYVRSRDNSEMVQLYLVVHSNYTNLTNFLKNIGFLYNSKRQLSKEMILKIKSNSKKDKRNVSKYTEVIELRNKGISAYKIAKLLELKVGNVKNWTYRKCKPKLFNKT